MTDSNRDNGVFRCHGCCNDFDKEVDYCEGCEKTFCDDCLSGGVCHLCWIKQGGKGMNKELIS